MELIAKALLLGIVVIAGVLLFTPYEAFLEGLIALAIVVTATLGFLIHPHRDVFYVRTSVRRIDPDRNRALDQDLLAVRVELVRLWLLFAPTLVAVAFLVFFAAGGPVKFSYLNWSFSSQYAYVFFLVSQYPPLLVLLLLSEWIGERRVLRDADACSARSFSVSGTPARHLGRVSYLFMGEKGEYYGGDCAYFGLVHPYELATIVFHDVQTPELNKIAMGFLFHRLVILGRGLTDLDRQTTTAQTVLAETASMS